MGWTAIHAEERPHLISYLKAREYRCVAFTSRLQEKSFSFLLPQHVKLMYVPGNGEPPLGAVLISRGGLILPVLDKHTDWRRDDLSGLKKRVISFVSSIHSILGTKRDVKLLCEALSVKPKTSVQYLIMDKPDFTFPEGSKRRAENITIRQAAKQDARRLYPLQYGYEHEEVLVHPERFNPGNCMALLKRSLTDQIIYLAEIDGIPVAKAGTNGIGFDYCQLGGIYTLPEHRGKGISTHLMEHLLMHIHKTGKHACLFVKKSNLPARHMYRNLGFIDREDFEVAYTF